MPAWPMAMPSVTVMVVNSRGVPLPALTPFFTAWAWRDSVMLQGAASFQVVATPTSGCAPSCSDRPMAYSIDRCGALVGPTVVCRLGNLDLSNFVVAMGRVSGLDCFAGTYKAASRLNRAVQAFRSGREPSKIGQTSLFAGETAMSVQPLKKTRTAREQVSPEEWQKRVDLAACYRLMDLYGMTEMTANHITTRVPGEDGAFLINPYGMLYDQMTASCFVKVDLDGKVLFNPTEFGINRAGYVIHSAIHRARHEVDCVIHSHTIAGMAVSAMKSGLLPPAQTFVRFPPIPLTRPQRLLP